MDVAIGFADEAGIESLRMRSLSLLLGVVPMALYKRVASKEERLDGMIDPGGEIDPPTLDVVAVRGLTAITNTHACPVGSAAGVRCRAR